MLQTTDPVCAQVQNTCVVAALPTDPRLTTEAVLQQQPDGTWTLHATVCTGHHGGATTARVTPELAREQAVRLVPHPAIGTAPAGITLVNIQTVLWLDTTTDRSLGTVTLLGHRVDLAVSIDHVDWDFGDSATATTHGPGRTYDNTHPCNTAQCPGYWGHTYANTGAVRITATTTWTGRFRVDHGPWRPITGTVTGPASTTSLTVRQARAVLVPDPEN